MASKKQYVLIVVIAFWGGASGSLAGITGGATGIVAGLLGGSVAGWLIGYVMVAMYNSAFGEQETLTVEDVR